MRVLFVTNRWPSLRTPGASPAIKLQVEAMRAHGHVVDVLSIDSQVGRSNYLWGAWRILWDVWIRGSYDVVHAHYGFVLGWVARLQWRRPVVVTYRGSDLMWKSQRRLSRYLSRVVDAVIVMTPEMKDLVGRSDAFIIPYGIDLSVFKPRNRAGARQRLRLPITAPLILFPYRTDRAVKRFDLVREAVDLVRPEFPDVDVVTISDEPSEVLAQYMSACDVMVLASEREGAPVAVREAVASELPVVSVDVGDVADLISEIDMCHVVERDSADIAEKIVAVLRAGKRSNGSAFTRNLDASHAASAVLNVYKYAVGGRCGSSTVSRMVGPRKPKPPSREARMETSWAWLKGLWHTCILLWFKEQGERP